MRFILDEELGTIVILYKEENWVSLGEKWEIISLNSFFPVILWFSSCSMTERQSNNRKTSSLCVLGICCERKIEFVKAYSDRCFPNTTKHYDLYSSGLYSNE